MDIKKLDIKFNFVNGYDGEPYVLFKIKGFSEPPLKIWEGLIADLLENPDMSGKGWKGLTRDYHELKGIWADGYEETEIDVAEYLDDLAYYANKSFNYEETEEMLESLLKCLNYVKAHGSQIVARFID